MTEGEIAANFVDNKVYIHNGTSAIPVAGKGEFVDLGSEQSVTGKKNLTAATVSTAPASANDVVRKTDLDTEVTAINAALTTETNARIAGDDALGLRIDALGSAFNYVGTINGGASAGAATNLASLTEKDAGDYYKVAAAGYFVLAPAAAFFANANDGIVFNLAAGVDLIDNTNASVSGTANEIEVTGSLDTGYTVAIDSVFSGRVTTLESTVGALGTMATQNANAVAITGGSISGVALTVTAPLIDLAGGAISNVPTPVAAGDVVNKGYTDDADTALSDRADDLESKTQNIDLAGTVAGTTVLTGALEISGAVEVTGNLVGTGTNQITDFVIDAGTF